MDNTKQRIIAPLVDSKPGVHLSIYINNSGDLLDLKSQLQNAIRKAEREIRPVMTETEVLLFLAPLRLLLTNEIMLRKLKHNFGVFRRSDAFRILALPIDVTSSCVVATSFHVKPLLRWARIDRDYLLLGVSRKAAFLYQGSRFSLKLVDTLELSQESSIYNLWQIGDNIHRALWESELVELEKSEQIADWLGKKTQINTSKLFIAGDSRIARAVKRLIHLRGTTLLPSRLEFREAEIESYKDQVIKFLESETKASLEAIMAEFESAEERRVTKRNIFEIAKAVSQGRVRKLVVADGIKIFGRFDSDSGSLKVHPRDLDHEDDDVLDDLAQQVLKMGGEVVVASRDEIPGGDLALAILGSRPFRSEARAKTSRVNSLLN